MIYPPVGPDNFERIVNEAEHGDPSFIYRDGKKVAVLIGWDDYQRLVEAVDA